MKKHVVDGVECWESSGNVFADLGLPNPEERKIKSRLIGEIQDAMARLGLTQQEAAKRMCITQPKLSDLLRGRNFSISERKLMDCLNRLGYDIEIKVKPTTEPIGHLILAIA